MSVLSIHINSVNAFGYSNYLLVSISYCTILRELENFPVFLVFLWLLYVMGNYGRDVLLYMRKDPIFNKKEKLSFFIF